MKFSFCTFQRRTAFTIVESLLMMVALVVFGMVAYALYKRDFMNGPAVTDDRPKMKPYTAAPAPESAPRNFIEAASRPIKPTPEAPVQSAPPSAEPMPPSQKAGTPAPKEASDKPVK